MSAGIRVSLFGPIRVLLDDAPLPPLRSRKAFSLLALLILRNGRPAARGWLATTLWPDADLATALSSLRPVVSELRKAFGPEGRRLKAVDRNSISFEMEGLSVDVVAFDQAIDAREFASAVEKYTGPFLEGCEEDWAFQERRIRQEAFLSALMRLGETAAEAGQLGEAVSIFRRAVGVDPFRDSPRRGMIQAYAASGDLNAALQEYREYASLLGGEFGTSPEEETTALYNRLRQEVRKPVKSPHVHRGGQSPQVGHIPTPLTALIGRDDERLDVSGLLRRSRLVTLTGFGGIGKTRLALAVAKDNANHFPDGAWFVRLEDVRDGDLVAQQVGDVLGLREIPGKSWLKGLTEHLREKKALLILDNCEHLQEPCAQLVLRLLSECPSLKALTTGRQALGILGEISWIVPALAVPTPGRLPEGRATLQRVAMGYEGIRLFVERAEAAANGFALTGQNARTVAEICFRLEGIPLALELAAARVKSLTLEQLLERLHAQLDLSLINRFAPSRQQTLRSTLEWSHGLLSEAEQVFFRRLSVFLGGWTIDAAVFLCADNESRDRISDLTSSLVDQSLIGLDAQSGRYRWSEIVRQFAEEKLRAADEAETFYLRRLDWSVAFAEEAEPMLKGAEQQNWLRRIEVEMPNLRAAADWAATNEPMFAAGLRLTGALSRFWYIRGDFKEGRARLAAALEHPGAASRTLARAKALYGLGILAYRQGDYDEAQASHEESLSIRRDLNDGRGVGESLLNLGNVAHSRGDHLRAEDFFEKALDILTEVDDKHGAALALRNLAIVKLSQGQNRVARPLLERSLEMWRHIGDRGNIAWDLNNLSILAAERGDYLASRAYLDECLILFEELGNRRGVAWTLQKLATIEREEERIEPARALLEESLTIFDDLGDKHGRACCIEEMSFVARDLGDLTAARSSIVQATELFREIDDRQAVAYATQRHGVLHRLKDDMDLALACNADALSAFMAAGELRGIMRVLQEQAMIAVWQGRYELAVTAWGAATAILDEHDLSIPPSELNLFEPQLSDARTALGDLAFETAFDKGKALKPEQTIDRVSEIRHGPLLMQSVRQSLE